MTCMRLLRQPVVACVAALLGVLLVAGSAAGHRLGGSPVALVTAESENELLAISLPGGAVLRRVRVASDPETVSAEASGPVVVVSRASGVVTVLAWRSLRPVVVLRGFRSPQLAAITPDGGWVYVTDAATGELSVVELAAKRVVDRVFVGKGAHHLAVSPDQRRTWVALGERASTIVVLDTSRPARPRVIWRFHPQVAAHDLVFAPDGRSVWVSSVSASYVSVLAPRNGGLLGKVPAGRPPQHIAFISNGGSRAFITSGYGSSIELVNSARRKVIRTERLPHGSFNLATSGDLVVTCSLLNGDVTEFNGAVLARWMNVNVASKTRDVAISVW
jgi:DNA-binding beta-propeller fold protein YncE